MGRAIAWVIGGFAALIFLGNLIKQLEPPRTYNDMARDDAARCVREKGYGAWRGSLGVSLADFCRATSMVEMRKQYCRDHPESC